MHACVQNMHTDACIKRMKTGRSPSGQMAHTVNLTQACALCTLAHVEMHSAHSHTHAH